VQWSPDGKCIAYGKSGNIKLMNVETEERKELLTGNADPPASGRVVVQGVCAIGR